jgi:putative Holliday junction resolvase
VRALGVDFGGKRIGVAVVDTVARLPAPRTPLAASGTLAKDAERLVELARKEEASTLVFGLPLLNGEETRFCQVVRQLAAHVQAQGLEVAFVDETLTSERAGSVLRDQGLSSSQTRRRLDSEAACGILESWLAEDR